MRFIEIITESSIAIDNMRNDVINLLTAMSASGISSIATNQLLIDLQSLGYTIDDETIIDILSDISIVASANSETIDIATSAGDQLKSRHVEKSDVDVVDKRAKAQARKGL
jgi:hypothetical protein